jgi:hypothetical protein
MDPSKKKGRLNDPFRFMDLPFEPRQQTLEAHVDMANPRDIAIKFTKGRGVLNRGQVKRPLKAVWGTLMACRQLSEELQSLMMKLFFTIALHDDTECTEVHNLPDPP